MYFSKGKSKVEIAVAKGKNYYEKRQQRKKEIGREKKLDICPRKTNDIFKFRINLNSSFGEKLIIY